MGPQNPMADCSSLSEIQAILLSITPYLFGAAKRNATEYGPGFEIPENKITRERISEEKLDDFLLFVSYDMQDLPLGIIVLKTSEDIKITTPTNKISENNFANYVSVKCNNVKMITTVILQTVQYMNVVKSYVRCACEGGIVI